MRHLLALLLIAATIVTCGCGNIDVSGGLNQSSFSGTVSIVRLTFANDGTQITLVTLINNMGSKDFNFCGNVVDQFPMNTSVQGSFTPGSPCGTIVKITITG